MSSQKEKKKVYVHYEGGSTTITVVLWVKETKETGRDLLHHAVVEFGRKYKELIHEERCTIQRESGIPINLDKIVGRIAHGEDLFVKPIPHNKDITSKTVTITTTTPTNSLTIESPTTITSINPNDIDGDLDNTQQLELSMQLKQEGNALMAKGKYHEASVKYESAIRMSPEYAVFYGNLSEALLRLHKYVDACTVATQATRMEPHNPKYLFRLGKAQMGMKEPHKAFNTFKKAQRISHLSKTQKKQFEEWIKKAEEKINVMENSTIKGKETLIMKTSHPSSTKIYDNTKHIDNIPEEASETSPLIVRKIQQSMDTALSYETRNNYKAAKVIYENILVFIPTHMDSLYRLARIWMKAQKWEEALSYLQKCCEISPISPKYHAKLGETLYHAGNLGSASASLSTALNLCTSQETFESKRANKIKVLIGRVLYEGGQKQSALTLFSNLISQDENNALALMEYGKIMLTHHKREEAIKVFLRLLVQKPDDTSIRKYFAESVQSGGMRFLLDQLQGTEAQSPKALAFIAGVVKDWGAIEESVELYRTALEVGFSSSMCPSTMTTYILNLVHVLEVQGKYCEAFEATLHFFKTHGSSVYVHYKDNTLTGDMIVDAFKHIDNLHHYNIINTLENFHHYDILTTKPHVINSTTNNDNDISGDGGDSGDDIITGEEREEIVYSDGELDFLALVFTLVKVVFVFGAVNLVPLLISLIEPVRGKNLHYTTIRNEHAYYCCIQKLITYFPHLYEDKDNDKYKDKSKDKDKYKDKSKDEDNDKDKSKDKGKDKDSDKYNNKDDDKDDDNDKELNSSEFIYICGDSHSLTCGWHYIIVDGVRRVLIPKLVTGVKMWHMRDESTFFPKNDFYNTVNTIPKGADVVITCGEIDCREGLLVSVDKCIYESIEEGTKVVVTLFIRILTQLYHKYKWKIMIHPVVPVLNETRSVVKLFNTIYKEHVDKTPHLHWLDFFHHLLTEDGDTFDQQYALDGTHMNPNYLPLLANAITSL